MKIDPTTLKLFISVLEEGTIAGAAERENIAAPAISKRISGLEDLLRTKLLNRTYKGVEPTAAGLALLKLARRAVNELDDIYTQMVDYASGVRGQVRIFANISAIIQFLPQELASFLAIHPHIQIHLDERNSTDTVKAVVANAADIGILTMLPIEGNVQLLPYQSDELVLIVPRPHPLAQRKSVSFSDTLAYNYVGLRTGSSINLQLKQAAAETNRPLKMRIQVTGYDAMCLMVAAGHGVAIGPKNVTGLFNKKMGIAEIRLNDPWARRELRICVRSQERLTVAAQLLVKHLQRSQGV